MQPLESNALSNPDRLGKDDREQTVALLVMSPTRYCCSPKDKSDHVEDQHNDACAAPCGMVSIRGLACQRWLLQSSVRREIWVDIQR